MSFRRSYEQIPSYDNSYDDNCPPENLPSFEIIQNNQNADRGASNGTNTGQVASVTTTTTRTGSTGSGPETDNIAQDKLRSRCQNYLDTILKDVGEDNGEREPMKIVIVGMPGVGKSSFVNSIAAAFSQEKWREYATVGSYGDEGEPITVYTSTFEKCANPEKYKDYRLPTIIDVAGAENEKNDLWKELFKIVFYGRLPEGDALYKAYKYGDQWGPMGLRDKYSQYSEELKVDRVIFLASATEEIPVNLIKCVREAARPGGDEDSKRVIPLYGIMTKIDLIGSSKVTQKDFEEREKLFIETMGLDGARHRYGKISNYTFNKDLDETEDDPTELRSDIDVRIMRFMTQVCDPAVRVLSDSHTYTMKAEDNDVPPSQRPLASEPRFRGRKPETETLRQNQQNTQKKEPEQNCTSTGGTAVLRIKQIFVFLAVVGLILCVYLLFAHFSKTKDSIEQ